eukprot:gnl/MRDRNA2_/MRDRNA2_166002_c0_seq1.p1 gnl/MRDRNA2_/MRDRNA2_166002_c0~~gnl/MRDRNA2_/MRDRNA2_166002_c0_seq1.p1  ORF type:complete len:825 (+),score=163.48 gnl/MRDRNA2_/MRDRNA2_166002_c0_seq1:68-2542(+)
MAKAAASPQAGGRICWGVAVFLVANMAFWCLLYVHVFEGMSPSRFVRESIEKQVGASRAQMVKVTQQLQTQEKQLASFSKQIAALTANNTKLKKEIEKKHKDEKKTQNTLRSLEDMPKKVKDLDKTVKKLDDLAGSSTAWQSQAEEAQQRQRDVLLNWQNKLENTLVGERRVALELSGTAVDLRARQDRLERLVSYAFARIGEPDDDSVRSTIWNSQHRSLETCGLGAAPSSPRLAMLVPIGRDNWHQLEALTERLESMMIGRAQADLPTWQLTIYALEQYENAPLNRGWLLNVGLNETDACTPQCIIVHDVGLLPEGNVKYASCDEPTLISSGIEGGVISMRPEHWRRVNGLSNDYADGNEVFIDLEERVKRIGLVRAQDRNANEVSMKRALDSFKDNRDKVAQGNQSDGSASALYRGMIAAMRGGSGSWLMDGLNSAQYVITDWRRCIEPQRRQNLNSESFRAPNHLSVQRLRVSQAKKQWQEPPDDTAARNLPVRVPGKELVSRGSPSYEFGRLSWAQLLRINKPYYLDPVGPWRQFHSCPRAHSPEVDGGPIDFLMAVKSAPGAKVRRDAVRKSYGIQKATEQIAKLLPGRRMPQMRLVFLLASTPDESLMASIAAEHQMHGDIIQWAFEDNWNALPLKELCFWHWLEEQCSRPAYIHKGDDDVFVNIVRLWDYLQNKSLPEDLITGFNCRPVDCEIPVREGGPLAEESLLRAKDILGPLENFTIPAKRKYIVSEEEWPLNKTGGYPNFPMGGSYLLSGSLAEKFHAISFRIRLFPMDDVLVGIWLEHLGVAPVWDKRFLKGEFLTDKHVVPSCTVPFQS